MAKKSSVEKNHRRRRLADAVRHQARRAARDRRATARASPEERFEATLALAELPRNSAKVRVRNRCALTGRPRGYHRNSGCRASRCASWLGRADPGPGQGQLVAWRRARAEEANDAERSFGRYADPHPQRSGGAQGGGQQPGLEAARSTSSKCWARGLHPRLQARGGLGHGELSIELKYHNGEPGDPRAEARVRVRAGGSIPASRTCRASTTGSASRSCRRRAA